MKTISKRGRGRPRIKNPCPNTLRMRKVYARRKRLWGKTSVPPTAWKRKNSILRDTTVRNTLGKYAEELATFKINGVSFYGRAA